MKRVALIALIAVAACGGTARAADLVLSLAASPRRVSWRSISWYYLNGGRRCWTPTNRGTAHRQASELPANKPPVPVPRSTVLWPALSLTVTLVDAALLTPEPATAWPLLIDVDELTSGPVADCCWPPLDEPPFRERWTALPSNWFELIGGMK